MIEYEKQGEFIMLGQDKFPVEIAEKIVKMLHQVTNGNVNFMDESGVIIATMQPERLGQIHEGAKKIMSGQMDELAISVEDAKKMQGTLPGYNGVVKYKGRRIGCIGMSGDPQKMRPLQNLATIIVREEFEKFQSMRRKQEILERVVEEVKEISASMKQISDGSEDVFDHSRQIQSITNQSNKFIYDINQVLKTVKGIADQTTLLGFNASIESARAGEYGKGFGIVAQEIRKLTTNSTESLKDVNLILGEIKLSLSQIAEKVSENTVVAHTQSEEIQKMNESVLRIKKEMESLTEKD